MRRRDLLRCLPLAALPAAARSAVTVSDVEAHVVKVNERGNWVLVRVKASNGLTGAGDASHGGPDAKKLEYIKQFANMVRGASVFDIEKYRRAAEPAILQGGNTAAIPFSSIEMALWDIIGKLLSVPAYELFGGRVHDQIRNYANINRSTPQRTPEGFARMAEKAVAAGFDAVKLAPFDGMPRNGSAKEKDDFTRQGIECARAVRQAIGPRRDLLIDGHNHFDLARGLDLARQMEPLNLFWLEEVTPARRLGDLAEINRQAKMPTAGGEAIFGVRGFLPYVNAKAVDIAMPDVKYCGGMLELKKIGALCDAAGMPVSPHGPASPVGNIAAAHVCAGMPNFQILEFSFGEVPWRAELVNPPEAMVNGRLVLSDRPGLGVEWNDRLLAHYRA